jgi:hypothetical protein
MVKKLNAQQVACAADAFGESNIVLAGRRIARRMVVLCAAKRYVTSSRVDVTYRGFVRFEKKHLFT